ncbi:ABC transporter permease [Terrabacter sp. C0L_2]|uniref:ABC transporter permease n=1 Tax=Terrabacter sp. C0L_2 TaxID=3108389 RepID=UPI002ED18D83|nr:ABC transporter permease [Terrabacter sp. C0L_2]
MRDFGIVFTLLTLFVALSVSSQAFLTLNNLLNIADQSATLGIVACGATVVFIAGGFDLSAGAVFGFAGVIAATVAINVDIVAGLLAGVVCGALIGLFNGVLTTSLRINALIATLASSVMITGVALAISDGKLLRVSDDRFTTLGQGRIFGVPVAVVIFGVVAVILSLALHRMTWGRYLYAVGGNAEAATLSGLRVNALRASTYVVGGALAGLAGVMAASRVGTGQANAGGNDLVMNAIAAVVIGGTSILGGAGAIWRTVVGIFVLALIQNGFNLLGVDIVFQRFIFGVILLFAVGIDARARRGAR